MECSAAALRQVAHRTDSRTRLGTGGLALLALACGFTMQLAPQIARASESLAKSGLGYRHRKAALHTLYHTPPGELDFVDLQHPCGLPVGHSAGLSYLVRRDQRMQNGWRAMGGGFNELWREHGFLWGTRQHARVFSSELRTQKYLVGPESGAARVARLFHQPLPYLEPLSIYRRFSAKSAVAAMHQRRPAHLGWGMASLVTSLASYTTVGAALFGLAAALTRQPILMEALFGVYVGGSIRLINGSPSFHAFVDDSQRIMEAGMEGNALRRRLRALEKQLSDIAPQDGDTAQFGTELTELLGEIAVDPVTESRLQTSLARVKDAVQANSATAPLAGLFPLDADVRLHKRSHFGTHAIESRVAP